MTAGRVFRVMMRFLIGAVLATGAIFAVYQIFGFPPAAPTGHAAAILRPAAALIAGSVAVFGLALAFSAPPWRRVLWAVRGAILIELVLAWFYYAHTGYLAWAEAAGVLVLLVIFHHAAHRHALGWIIDEQGERQKVDHWHKGRAVYNATTWKQRMIEEALRKSERRKTLGFSLLFAAPLSYAAYHFYGAHNWLVVGCAGFVDALVLLFGVLPNLLQELLYQVGYQDMAGAKVLDPEVQRRGIQEIAEQKAHGDASLADEQEAMGLLNRGA